jgi:hypothetical protein
VIAAAPLLALAVAAASLGWAAPPPGRPPVPRCLPAGVSLKNPSVFHPTPAQRREIADGLRNPSVVGFHDALAAFVQDKADSETTATLKNVDRERLADRFVLLSRDANLVGGDVLLVEFAHHRDAVYWVWMYKLGGVDWVVRWFERTACSPEELKWINIRYREIFDGRRLARPNRYGAIVARSFSRKYS